MSKKLPKMVYIIPILLVLHFGENFVIIQSKIPKLQIHEKLHKNVNENMFSFTFFMQFFIYFYRGQLQQLYTANFLYVFNPFKMGVQFRFAQFDGPKCFLPPKSTGPWPRLQKGRKILGYRKWQTKIFYFRPSL